VARDPRRYTIKKGQRMANRAYLYFDDKNVKYVDLQSPNVACAFDYGIPVFWYMLFAESDLVEASTPSPDGIDFKYFRLVSNKEAAIDRAKSRIRTVANILGNEAVNLFNIWIEYIDSLPGTLLMLESCEICLMEKDADVYKQNAVDCIKAFSFSELNRYWQLLLSQSQIDEPDQNIEADRVCGYSWDKKVPWEIEPTRLN
jgi:hypothetical protein